jgi:hypothetical protein
LYELIKIQNGEERKIWLEDMKHQELESVKNKSEEQKHLRLDDKQK